MYTTNKELSKLPANHIIAHFNVCMNLGFLIKGFGVFETPCISKEFPTKSVSLVKKDFGSTKSFYGRRRWVISWDVSACVGQCDAL